MQSVDEIVEAIHKLPSREREKIRQTLEREKSEKDDALKQDLERYRQATQWIELHREEYMNQWVCLYGDKLISHGMDGMEVHRQAKEAGIKSPFMVRIVEEPKNFVGAWL